MSTNRFSVYGNQQNTDQNQLEIKAFLHEFKSEKERADMMEKLRLGSQFDMRYRAIFYYYGDDLIAYKRKHPSSQQVNEFLRVFSAYLTYHLEDDCPPSWKDCSPSFWEEFIYTIYPNYMLLTKKQNQAKIFTTQLKKFVYWLDQRSNTSWYPVVEQLADEALPELSTCENLLNRLLLHAYPNLQNENWDPSIDISILDNELERYSHTYNSVFEVKNLEYNILTVRDLDTKNTYQIVDFPINKVPQGILLDGIIGKNNTDLFWSWHLTLCVYPNKAGKYIYFKS